MLVPEVLGLGTETVGDILNGGPAPSFLISVLILKLLLTALCIGFGMFGGVFSPALFVGAAAGGFAGSVMITLFGFGSHTALAICGMAAVASAVIGAPVAGVLIILEMTMNYEFALVAMVSVVAAIMVTNVLFGHSFFDRQLLDRGIDIAQGRGSHRNDRDAGHVGDPDRFCAHRAARYNRRCADAVPEWKRH